MRSGRPVFWVLTVTLELERTAEPVWLEAVALCVLLWEVVAGLVVDV